MKKYIHTAIPVLIFLIGLTLFLYPTVSNLYNEHKNSLLIDNYKETVLDIKEMDKERYLEEAHTYNKHLYDEAKLSELGLSYDNVLNMYGNGIMGYIEIPKISVELVIYHTVNDDLLQNAIGHVEESSMPVGGSSTHAVLAGHRGLPSAKLLTNIDHLKIGDLFYIHVLDEVMQYKVDDISVVEPDDISRLKIENGKDYVTLVTCTPYGVNSHRLLVRGERVPDEKIVYDGNMLNVSDDILHINPIYIVPVGLILLVLIVYAIKSIRDKRRKKERGDDNNNEQNI